MGQGPIPTQAFGKDAAGKTIPLLVNDNGQLLAASNDYETVAASQTKQVLGGAGAIGDVLASITYIPATTAAGVVTLFDGNTSIPLFVGGGTTALTDLAPRTIPLNLVSKAGPWSVTTGANVSVIATGRFSA